MSDKNPGAPKVLRKQDRASAVARTERNKAARAVRHANRMEAQATKRPWGADGFAATRDDIKVPRGTKRRLRRAPLQALYAKRMALGNLA